jgi:hypothetical protein
VASASHVRIRAESIDKLFQQPRASPKGTSMSRARKKIDSEEPNRPTVWYEPSHSQFEGLVTFCARGWIDEKTNTPRIHDHLGETCNIALDDLDAFLWFPKNSKEGVAVNEILMALDKRVYDTNDLEAAEILYAIATESALKVMSLYLRHRHLFDQIAPRRNILPSFFSIHPKTAALMARMRAESKLGTLSWHSRQVGSRAYFVSDAPANIYARAIITSIEMNSRLDSLEKQKASWADFDRDNFVTTIMLPFPKYVDGLDALPAPVTPASVLEYWRKGKEIILEEMPDFHERPEWKDYQNRKYKGGAKKGAIQHAIFKDILVALKTIAGANKKRSKKDATGLKKI